MKKKIKDLTLKELRKICLKHSICERCPLSYDRGFCVKNFIEMLHQMEKEIEV